MERTMTYSELTTVFNIYKTTLDNIEKDFLDNVHDKLLENYSKRFNHWCEQSSISKIAALLFGCAPKYKEVVSEPLHRIRTQSPDWRGCWEEREYYDLRNAKWKLNEIEKKLKLWHHGSITLDDDELETFKYIAEKSLDNQLERKPNV